MVCFPNCKINLGLHVTGKRPDGYHNLETVFFPVPVSDALEIITQTSSTENDIVFTATGLPIAGNADQNLCVKAYRLLQQDYSQLPAVHMHLHKVIPMGAGLGGGSADGAFALQLLNNKYQLGINENKLIDYALRLGSDCPFFIYNKPCFATGRGEIMEPVTVDLSGYKLVLINPGIHVATAAAFATLQPKAPAISIRNIIQQPVTTWKDVLRNDFETTVFQLHPEIAAIKQNLYDQGAVYAAMTGTGSTVFGIFEAAATPLLEFPESYTVIQTEI